MSRVGVIIIAASVLALSLGAGRADGIKIGISQPISGPNGDYFKRELVNPVILAIEEANAKGGVLGQKVEYVIEDHQGNAATALAVAHKLIEIDHVSMISISISPAVLATLPVAEDNNIVVMSAAQHPKIAQSPWGFMDTPMSTAFGTAAGHFAGVDLKAATLGAIIENTDAIRLESAALKTAFESSGGKLVDMETFNTGDTDYRAQLTKLRAANPEAIYIEATAPHYDGVVLKQAAELNFQRKYTISGDFVADRLAREVAGDLVVGIYYPEVEFDHHWGETVFKSRFGYDADGFAARSYDGAAIYLAAVQKAGTTDPVKVRDTLRHLTDYHGVLGTWGYEGTGAPEMPIIIKQVK
jgi:branched-chain amino acid transport system substrate-binding protein